MGTPSAKRFIVPEVIQTSAMDCGPAALKALLEGFRIPASYGRLREACQTDVDGTSIDTVEEVARQLGLDAQQVLLPLDHVLMNESAALPAIAVVRGATGLAHFVIVWRTHGPFVQVMDPARGRLVMPRRVLLDQLFVHAMPVPAHAWREWAGSDAFQQPLNKRLKSIGLGASIRRARLSAANGDSGWKSLAALDAATRMVATLRSTRAVSRAEAPRLLDALLADADASVPEQYWSAWSKASNDQSGQIDIRGVVLVKVPGKRAASDTARGEEVQLSPELKAALTEPPLRPLRDLAKILRADGPGWPVVAGVSLAVGAAGVVFEALLLRSAVDIGRDLRGPEQVLSAMALLIVFSATLLGLDVAMAAAERRMGGHLEGRLRILFLDKLPRLADAYFHSRPMADMLERSHTVHMVRLLPRLATRFLRVVVELLVTTLGLIWLSPDTAALAVTAAVMAAAIPIVGQAFGAERDLRARTHAGALARFHLDALRGRTALESHGAAGAIEREHDGLLAEWTAAMVALQRTSLSVEALQLLVGFGLVAWMLLGHLPAAGGSGLLLQMYWMLNLPALGYELALIAREYPAYRSTILRVLEPLGAPQFEGDAEPGTATASPNMPPSGVRVEARGVAVRAAGHGILEEVDLQIAPGTHVAIVGSSGAGKSTLVGLLLGWHRPAAGELLIDGHPPTPARVDALRRATAWVDPTVEIWNRPLLDNLLYGSGNSDDLGSVLDMAGLLPVVARLPQGLATPLGESGALLSAGEAQRVRLARAMLRRDVRLAILDEPFLGLERDRRRALLAHTRQHWAAATMLYVTHDVSETRAFDRVVVVEHGRIVEDGDPLQLAQMASSRYRRLLLTHESLQSRFATSTDWKRIRLESGRIVGDHVRTNEQTA